MLFADDPVNDSGASALVGVVSAAIASIVTAGAPWLYRTIVHSRKITQDGIADEAKQFREDLRKELIELREKFNVLQEKHINCMMEAAAQRERNASLITDNSELKRLFESVTKDNDELKKLVQVLTADNEELKSRVHALELEVGSVRKI